MKPHLAALAVVLLAADARAADGPAVTVVKAARLLDGRGGQPTAPVMVRMGGERIAKVGMSIAVPEGARVLDLGGTKPLE